MVRNLRLLGIVGVLWCALSTPASIGADQAGTPGTAGDRPPPGGMILIAGYKHQQLAGLDTTRGRIVRDDGFEILYDIGDNAGNKARGLAENDRRAWSFTTRSGNGEIVIVTMDEAHDIVIITVGGWANFEATRVQRKRDIAEMLAMAVSYDIRVDLGIKK